MFTYILLFNIYKLLIGENLSFAFPTFIRSGYFSCHSCHQSPMGTGFLTAYGKGISKATSFKSGEVLVSKPSLMEHGMMSRVMGIKKENDSRFFPMQMDYLGNIFWHEKLRQDIILAMAPKSKNAQVNGQNENNLIDRLYLRKFNLEIKVMANHQVSLGLSPLPLGLGIVDHTAYVRGHNRLSVLDIPFHFLWLTDQKNWRAQNGLFGPNPNDLKTDREWGALSKWEFSPTKFSAIGLQGLISKGQTIDRELMGLMTRFGNEQYSLLGELNFTQRTIRKENIKFDQWTGYLEAALYPKEFFKFFIHQEFLKVQDPFLNNEKKWGVGADMRWDKWLTTTFEVRRKQYLCQLVMNFL